MPGSPEWFASAPPAEQAAYFRTRCESHGFQSGTHEMAQCIQNECLRREAELLPHEQAFGPLP